jgi:hypothetical protein
VPSAASWTAAATSASSGPGASGIAVVGSGAVEAVDEVAGVVEEGGSDVAGTDAVTEAGGAATVVGDAVVAVGDAVVVVGGGVVVVGGSVVEVVVDVVDVEVVVVVVVEVVDVVVVVGSMGAADAAPTVETAIGTRATDNATNTRWRSNPFTCETRRSRRSRFGRLPLPRARRSRRLPRLRRTTIIHPSADGRRCQVRGCPGRGSRSITTASLDCT